MNLLPHWVLTDKFPAFYDSESKTAIEQTSRVYGAMQELITEYNKFVDNTNSKITEFMNGTGEDAEAFRVGIRQEFQDFIDTASLHIQGQDKDIEEINNYMVTNLRKNVELIIEGMKGSGELNKEIMNAMDDIVQSVTNETNEREKQDALLSERITNLATLPEGSTTGDAELIDGRMDYLGNVHSNIGEHIRTVTSNLSEEIDELQDGKIENKNMISVEFAKGMISETTGEISTSGRVYSSMFHSENGLPIRITYDNSLMIGRVFKYDMDGNFIAPLTSQWISKGLCILDYEEGVQYRIHCDNTKYSGSIAIDTVQETLRIAEIISAYDVKEIHDLANSTSNAFQNRQYVFALRSGVKYPNYNTVDGTLTIYKGTVIMNMKNSSGTELFRAENDIVLTKSTSSQVNIVTFNVETLSFNMYSAYHTLSDSEILIGTISGKVGWLICPHTVDGTIVGLSSADGLSSSFRDKIQKVQDMQGTDFTFAIQTDTHFDSDNSSGKGWCGDTYGRCLKLFADNVGMDFIANLGDIIEGYPSDTTEDMKADMTALVKQYVDGVSCPVLLSVGNHDYNTEWATANNGECITHNEIYSRMMKPIRNTSEKFRFPSKNATYYYLDFDEIRVIMLNDCEANFTNGIPSYIFNISNEQVAWFRDVALDTDKQVLILAHAPLVSELTGNVPINANQILGAIDSFVENGGVVIGCMYGHTHNQTSTVKNGINHITFLHLGNRAEVVMINTEGKTIRTQMVGYIGSTGTENRNWTY